MKNVNGIKILTYTGRVLLVIVTLLLAAVVALYCVMLVLAKGPSPTARDLFVRSVMETSAAKFLARMYFTEEEIEAILDIENSGSDRTDAGLIQIPGATNNKDKEKLPFEDQDKKPPSGADTSEPGADDTTDVTTPPDTTPPEPADNGVEVIDIKGGTYNGKLIIVKDPSRVRVGTLPTYGDSYTGKTLRKFISETGAIGGINAGGFYDEGGSGTGAEPDGIVIRGGEIIWGTAEEMYHCVIGFDKNNILHVGNMTGAQALADGIVDGLSFEGGPLLVVNGVPETTKHKLNGGLNPRTAIGQRADGAILLLVINGRQANSLGATHADTCNIMASYGAVNAANLDGGSSSLMIYDGETLTQSAYFLGERKLPNVFLIMPE